MDELPLQALRVFGEVVRHGGVRAAARALGIAHSAVSRRLGELERVAGTPLFLPRRHPGDPLQLTTRGRELASAVDASFARLHAALGVGPARRPDREVVVSTTESFATRWLLPRLPAFHRLHPRARVSLSVRAGVEDPSRGDADVALRMGSGPWPHARPWKDEVLVPVAHPQLARGRRPWPLKALLDLPLLHDQDPSTRWERWRDAVGPEGLDVSRGQTFASSHLVIEAAVQGMGVALARRRLAQRELEAGLLVQPFGRYEVRLPQAYWIVVHPDRAADPAVRRFVRWLDDAVHHGDHEALVIPTS